MGRRKTGLGMAVLAAATGAAMAMAQTVAIEVSGLRSDKGVLRAAICTRAEFLSPSCSHSGEAPAAAGRLTIDGVVPGTWAVQVFHDEDGDGDLDRRGLRPLEGMGFSRDARMRFGPPRFEDAAFGLIGDARVVLTMRYFR